MAADRSGKERDRMSSNTCKSAIDHRSALVSYCQISRAMSKEDQAKAEKKDELEVSVQPTLGFWKPGKVSEDDTVSNQASLKPMYPFSRGYPYPWNDLSNSDRVCVSKVQSSAERRLMVARLVSLDQCSSR